MSRGRWAPWRGEGHYSSGPRPPQREGIRIRSQRGEIGATWWGRKWIAALARFGWESRLARGRAYARKGQVVDLRLRPGQATAKVQGSRPKPYRVQIAVRPISERAWQGVTRSFAERSGIAAALLSGEMPNDVEEVFRTAHQPLFPQSDDDFQSDCNCPDWANPCKHIAAVHYVIGEALDRDPFLLFLLRGRPRESLMEELRKVRSRRPSREVGVAVPVKTSRVPRPPRGLPARPSDFWKPALPTSELVIRIGPPRIARAPLRRLGEPPFLRGDPEAVRTLERLYDRISARALALAIGETPRSAPAEAKSPAPHDPSVP